MNKKKIILIGVSGIDIAQKALKELYEDFEIIKLTPGEFDAEYAKIDMKPLKRDIILKPVDLNDDFDFTEPVKGQYCPKTTSKKHKKRYY